MKIYVYLLLLSIVLVSCGPSTYFSEPQPMRIDDEFMFKHKFQGEYTSMTDSSIIIVSEYKIIQKWDYILKFTKQELDSIVEIDFRNYHKNVRAEGYSFNVKIDGDTASVRFLSTKSIFHISTSNLLRYYKSTYFLNYRTSDSLWNVKILNLNRNGELSFRSLKTSEDKIKSLKDITKVDTVSSDNNYTISPSKREIRKILRSDLFTEDSKFIKVE